MEIIKNIYSNTITFLYNANDEEPNCMSCDHCCDGQIICDKCGPEFWWANYVRTENEQLKVYQELFKGDK